MINNHPQTVGEMLDQAGYFPTVCTNHDQPHAVNRDDATGEMRCTAGCIVAPVIRDAVDRIGEALKGAKA